MRKNLKAKADFFSYLINTINEKNLLKISNFKIILTFCS